MLPQAAGRLVRGARTLSTASGAQLACLDDVRRSVPCHHAFHADLLQLGLKQGADTTD